MKTFVLSVATILLFSVNTLAFTKEQRSTTSLAESIVSPTDTATFVSPEFPGGWRNCLKWIAQQIEYPKTCAEKRIEGTVQVEFIINADGKIQDITPIESPDSLLTTEAIRVLKIMPAWKPGLKNGVPVRVKYTLPVTFRLSSLDENGCFTGPCIVVAKKEYTTATGKVEHCVANASAKEKAFEFEDRLFEPVDVAPEFPGGMESCLKWIIERIKYPEDCWKMGLQGRVLVEFVVMKDGSVAKVKAIKSPDKSLAAEAERVIKSMPRWKPGERLGEPVNVKFFIPVMFRLNPEP